MAAFSIEDATYDSKFDDVSGQVSFLRAIFFKPDGLKMYVVDGFTDSIYQYTLSVAWDISTSSYASKVKDISDEDVLPQGLFFKDDGTKMYISGSTNDKIYQYTLSTAWDVSTASYDSKFLDVSSEATSPQNCWFKTDGTKVFVIDVNNDKVFQYTLSTAWDISTATYDSKFHLFLETFTLRTLCFNDDGTKMYAGGSGTDGIAQYTLSTAWDVSTATYDSIKFVNSEDTDVRGMFWKDDGEKFYFGGNNNTKVYQYSVAEAVITFIPKIIMY